MLSLDLASTLDWTLLISSVDLPVLHWERGCAAMLASFRRQNKTLTWMSFLAQSHAEHHIRKMNTRRIFFGSMCGAQPQQRNQWYTSLPKCTTNRQHDMTCKHAFVFTFAFPMRSQKPLCFLLFLPSVPPSLDPKSRKIAGR